MTNPSPLAQEFLSKGRFESFDVIDMHTHPGPYSAIWFPNAAPEKMIRTMDRSGVRLICAAPHCALTDSERGNAYTERICAKWPTRIFGYWSINPNYPDRTNAEVEDFGNHKGFVGFKFLSSYHQYPLTGEVYRPVLELADAEKLLVLMHTWSSNPYNNPKQVEELAKRYPNAILLMGHSCFGDWDTSIRLALEYPNVHLELTAVHDANGVFEKMVDAGCTEKMLYGTDLPWFDPHYVIATVLFARISDEDRHNILHRNAERLLARWL